MNDGIIGMIRYSVNKNTNVCLWLTYRYYGVKRLWRIIDFQDFGIIYALGFADIARQFHILFYYRSATGPTKSRQELSGAVRNRQEPSGTGKIAERRGYV